MAKRSLLSRCPSYIRLAARKDFKASDSDLHPAVSMAFELLWQIKNNINHDNHLKTIPLQA